MISDFVNYWCIYASICTLLQMVKVYIDSDRILKYFYKDNDYGRMPYGHLIAALLIAPWISLAPFLVPIWLSADYYRWACRLYRKVRGRG